MTNYNTSLLHLNLKSASGSTTIAHAIPKQQIKLIAYNLQWSAAATSLTAGSYVTVDLGDVFSSTMVNSNNPTISNTLVLLNDTSSITTVQECDIPLHLSKKINEKFKYSIKKSDGADVANLTSLNLIFSYESGNHF